LNASTSGGTSTGITTADYTVPNYTMPGPYYYYCAVSSSSNTSKVTSDLFTVTVINIPSAGDPGKGQFIAGETCFDVNAGGNATCGATANRSTMDLSVTYTYTFKHVTANKNLQFLLKDAVGAVELIGFSSGSGDLSAIPAGAPAVTLTAINTALAGKTSFTAESTYNITFKFKNTLNQQGGNPTAYGTTNSNPLEVTLSALYEDNASTLRIENRVISIKDCNCCGNPDSPGTLVYNGITYRTAAYATGTDGSEQCWMITPSEVGTTNLCNVSYTLVGYTSTPSDASVCPAGWRIPTRTEASLLNPDLSSSYWQREGWVIQGTWAGCQSMNYNELRMLTTDTTGYYWRNADLWEWRSRISDENIQVRCIYDY
jgi:hypothetical protein